MAGGSQAKLSRTPLGRVLERISADFMSPAKTAVAEHHLAASRRVRRKLTLLRYRSRMRANL